MQPISGSFPGMKMNWCRQKYLRQFCQTSNKLTLDKLNCVYNASSSAPHAAKNCVYTLLTKKPKLVQCMLTSRSPSSTENWENITHINGDSPVRVSIYSNFSEGIHSQIKTQGRERPRRLLFFGTDKFSARILQILNENRTSGGTTLIDKLDVVSNVGKTVVRQYAESAGLTVHDWPVPDLSGCFDLGVLASFGHLIPGKVISLFPHGILNVHPSLLPRWRGASPIIHTILSGDKVTGVSIMKLRPKHFDIGTVLSQLKVPVPDAVTSYQLRDLLADQGGQLLLDTLKHLPDLKEKEQDEIGVTYAHKVPNSMAFLNWERQTCDNIHRQYRALGEIFLLRTELNGIPVKLLDIQQVTNDSRNVDRPGTVLFDKRRKILCVKCRDGWVGFENIVIRSKMSAQAFYNGYLQRLSTDKKLYFTSLQNGLETETYNTRI